MARIFFLKYHTINYANHASISMLEPLCSQTHVEGAVAVELYQRLLMADNYHRCGDDTSMEYHLLKALQLALPDRLYTPLAEARNNLGLTFDRILKAESIEAYQSVKKLHKRLIPSWAKIYEQHMNRPIAGDLSTREIEVMKYAASGLTNEEIARQMHLSVGTVKCYVSESLQKTGLSSRHEFASFLGLS